VRSLAPLLAGAPPNVLGLLFHEEQVGYLAGYLAGLEAKRLNGKAVSSVGGIAVPAGTRSDGLPASVTLLAPAGKDGLAATLARQIHAGTGLKLGATGWSQPELPPIDAMVPEAGIPLVVVGAHISGMPLNAQLRAIGAVFDRAAATTPDYRLYALPNQSPPKPGLIRALNGDGVSIETEVWRLPAAAFAAFIDAIPAPLGIGTVALADGTSAKGFLVEGAGLKGATDISHFGGWRAYCAASPG